MGYPIYIRGSALPSVGSKLLESDGRSERKTTAAQETVQLDNLYPQRRRKPTDGSADPLMGYPIYIRGSALPSVGPKLLDSDGRSERKTTAAQETVQPDNLYPQRRRSPRMAARTRRWDTDLHPWVRAAIGGFQTA